MESQGRRLAAPRATHLEIYGNLPGYWHIAMAKPPVLSFATMPPIIIHGRNKLLPPMIIAYCPIIGYYN